MRSLLHGKAKCSSWHEWSEVGYSPLHGRSKVFAFPRRGLYRFNKSLALRYDKALFSILDLYFLLPPKPILGIDRMGDRALQNVNRSSVIWTGHYKILVHCPHLACFTSPFSLFGCLVQKTVADEQNILWIVWKKFGSLENNELTGKIVEHTSFLLFEGKDFLWFSQRKKSEEWYSLLLPRNIIESDFCMLVLLWPRGQLKLWTSWALHTFN